MNEGIKRQEEKRTEEQVNPKWYDANPSTVVDLNYYIQSKIKSVVILIHLQSDTSVAIFCLTLHISLSNTAHEPNFVTISLSKLS